MDGFVSVCDVLKVTEPSEMTFSLPVLLVR